MDGMSQLRFGLGFPAGLKRRLEPKPRVTKKRRSSCRGVCWDARNQKWKSQIGYGGQTHYLGYHDSEVEAALAYDRAARAYHGAKARVNFSLDGKRTTNTGNRCTGRWRPTDPLVAP